MRKFALVSVALALTVSVLYADGRMDRPVQAGAAQTADGFPATGAPPAITLLSTGAAPRAALRYKVPAGTKARTEMSTAMGMTMEMAGMALPEMKLPTMKMVVDISVDAVAPNGDMTFTSGVSSMTFDATGVDPTIAAGMAGMNTDLSSVKTSGTMSNRGITNQKLELDKITDPALKQMMDTAGTALQSISFPLPEEPVGIGAKWEIRQRMAASGVETMAKQTVEVIAIQGSKVTLKVTVDQTAPPQQMKNPALPAEAEVSLLKFTGTGTTTSVLDLVSLSSEGEGTMSMAMVMQVKMQGMEQNMSMTTGLKIKTTPVK
jgi:hypothetical protein